MPTFKFSPEICAERLAGDLQLKIKREGKYQVLYDQDDNMVDFFSPPLLIISNSHHFDALIKKVRTISYFQELEL